MDSSLVRIVHTGGMLIIGIASGNKLESPRVLDLIQGPQGQVGVRLLQLIGNPKVVDVGDFAFSYECQDEGVVNGYRENVTGLSLVKQVPGNLVQAGLMRQ